MPLHRVKQLPQIATEKNFEEHSMFMTTLNVYDYIDKKKKKETVQYARVIPNCTNIFRKAVNFNTVRTPEYPSLFSRQQANMTGEAS